MVRATTTGNPFIDLCGLLARETHRGHAAAGPKPKENVEILHDFVKSQLKPNRKK